MRYLLGYQSPKGICFSDDKNVVISNYWGELINVQLSDERVTRQLIAQNGISAICRNGKNLVASSYDGSIYLVEPKSLKIVNKISAMTQKVAAPAYS